MLMWLLLFPPITAEYRNRIELSGPRGMSFLFFSFLLSDEHSQTSLHVPFFSSRDHQPSFLETYSGNAYMNQQLAHEKAFQALVICVAPDSASILHKHVMASGQKSKFTMNTRSFVSNDTKGVLLVPGGSYWAKWTQLSHKSYPWPSWAELCRFQLALPILTEGKGLRQLPDKFWLFTFCWSWHMSGKEIPHY